MTNATQKDDTASGANTKPYDRLMAAARKAMIAAYPDKAKQIAAGKHNKIEDSFTLDALGEKGKCMYPHRLSDEKLEEEIGPDADAIFQGLSQSMTDFYRRKLDEAKSK